MVWFFCYYVLSPSWSLAALSLLFNNMLRAARRDRWVPCRPAGCLIPAGRNLLHLVLSSLGGASSFLRHTLDNWVCFWYKGANAQDTRTEEKGYGHQHQRPTRHAAEGEGRLHDLARRRQAGSGARRGFDLGRSHARQVDARCRRSDLPDHRRAARPDRYRRRQRQRRAEGVHREHRVHAAREARGLVTAHRRANRGGRDLSRGPPAAAKKLHRIMPARVPRIAPKDPPSQFEETTDKAVFFYCLIPILTAGWMKSTKPVGINHLCPKRMIWRQHLLIQSDREKKWVAWKCCEYFDRHRLFPPLGKRECLLYHPCAPQHIVHIFSQITILRTKRIWFCHNRKHESVLNFSVFYQQPNNFSHSSLYPISFYRTLAHLRAHHKPNLCIVYGIPALWILFWIHAPHFCLHQSPTNKSPFSKKDFKVAFSC